MTKHEIKGLEFIRNKLVPLVAGRKRLVYLRFVSRKRKLGGEFHVWGKTVNFCGVGGFIKSCKNDLCKSWLLTLFLQERLMSDLIVPNYPPM